MKRWLAFLARAWRRLRGGEQWPPFSRLPLPPPRREVGR